MMDQFATESDTSTTTARLLRRAFLLALIPAVVLAGKMAESAEFVAGQKNGDSWTIDIQPQRNALQVVVQNGSILPPDDAQPAEEAAPLPQQRATEDAPFPQQDTQPAPDVEERIAPAPMPPEAAEEQSNDWGIDIVPNPKFTMNGMTYRQAYDSIPFSRSEYLANPAYRHDAAMELLTGVPRQSVHSTYEARLNDPIRPQPQFIYNPSNGGYGPGGGGGYGFGFNRGVYPPTFRYFLPLNFGL